jgi:glycosyltransferase involved in cell wall biosynthesis
LSETVHFIGYVDYDVLLDYYQAADLLFSASYQEAGPACLSFAACMELPAILTDTGIAGEFYKKNNLGTIVPVDGYDQWPIAIEEVLNGKKINVPDRKLIEDFGDWEKVAQYYYDVYKSILKL